MDTSIALIRALVENMDGPQFDRENWESFALIIDSYEGTFNAASGYTYSPDGTISAVAADPWKVIPFVDEYVQNKYKPGESLPVKLLVQFERTTGRYTITFEDTDVDRWKVSPATIRTIRQELRPVFDAPGESSETKEVTRG
ncbi:MAG: hypothetical protein ACREGE_04305 [Candidatus Microsaccharimonas sp.]